MFADTVEVDRQDRVCGLLVHLSLLADTAKRRAAWQQPYADFISERLKTDYGITIGSKN